MLEKAVELAKEWEDETKNKVQEKLKKHKAL